MPFAVSLPKVSTPTRTSRAILSDSSVLTVNAPAGVTVEEIVYPEPKDLRQENAPLPLSVRTGVRDRRRARPGDRDSGPPRVTVAPSLPGMQRETVLPADIRAGSVDVPIGAAGKARTNREVFGRIRFGTGEAPLRPPRPPQAARRQTIQPAANGDPAARLDRFTTLGTAAGYLDREDFLTFIHNAENGIVEKGWFEGRGPLAIVLIVIVGGLALNLTPCVLPMIPINLAIIGAGAQADRGAGVLLGATAARWPWSTASSD